MNDPYSFKRKLINTPGFKCHSCLHLPEIGKEAHKLKLGNFNYERVNKFCYLGDMLSAGCRAEASSITRIRTGWKKFRELLPILISRVFSCIRKLVSGVLSDSIGQKCRWLDGFVTSVCLRENPLKKYEVGEEYNRFLWSCNKCDSGGVSTKKGVRWFSHKPHRKDGA